MTHSLIPDILNRKTELVNRRKTLRLTLNFRHMKWHCPESGYVLSYPITEVMNKPSYCNGCGKIHLYVPGDLNEEDTAIIAELRSTIEEEENLTWFLDSPV